ncbi:exopolysaccharide biosynthesis polyprenyl glycosylphosphotransferase [Halomonas sp. NO4]|uniref:exopolysaccharide biosynthesis polyprenyl glycosylphosphotransferase n=1 Tax=Halomonas sp. NO4 TaxID=2484813 RepID=UPI001F091B57|nr:exopolysaccharide biosynthesis polyprenyl glycosylphosphotransferase [Halomonas sp. NO4]
MNTLSNVMEHQRRRSRFSERLILSRRVQFATGLCLVVLIPAIWLWGWGFWSNSEPSQGYTMGMASIAYAASIISAFQLARFPGMKLAMLAIPGLALCFGASIAAVTLLELSVDRHYLYIALVVALLWTLTHYLLIARHHTLRLAVVPYGRVEALCANTGAEWCPLSSPSLAGGRVDGVVMDAREPLPDEWKRFLADCTINGIPVYQAETAQEMVTGRVSLDHLVDNQYGSLRPRDDYDVIKRCLDFIGAAILIPATLPIMLLVGVAIRLDSPGPVLFKQQRMGYHCRPFTVYKFRSMFIDQAGLDFTSEGHDPRISRVGHVIRKYRFDELPQLFNVLKGDMSLIGPRPESMNLTDWYEKDVPFFFYRHMVKPGITGWAQVEQGYAAEVDGMVRKIEYDFYYIKHISLWLDLLIVIKTIRILVTGFGSR